MRPLRFSLAARSLLIFPVRTMAPAPVLMAAPIFSWTGFYVGVNAGYAGDKFEYPYSGDVSFPRGKDTRLVTYGGKPSITSSGGVFGGQVGYNWQFASRWVIGLEADYQWANIEGRANINGLHRSESATSICPLAAKSPASARFALASATAGIALCSTSPAAGPTAT